jgi:hypothetical protein
MAASRVHPDENGSLTLSIRSADIYQFAKDTDHLSLAYALLPGKCRQRSQRTWGGLPLLPQAQSIARYGYVMSTARLTSSSTAPAKNLEARSVTRCGVVPAAAKPLPPRADSELSVSDHGNTTSPRSESGEPLSWMLQTGATNNPSRCSPSVSAEGINQHVGPKAPKRR